MSHGELEILEAVHSFHQVHVFLTTPLCIIYYNQLRNIQSLCPVVSDRLSNCHLKGESL